MPNIMLENRSIIRLRTVVPTSLDSDLNFKLFIHRHTVVVVHVSMLMYMYNSINLILLYQLPFLNLFCTINLSYTTTF